MNSEPIPKYHTDRCRLDSQRGQWGQIWLSPRLCFQDYSTTLLENPALLSTYALHYYFILPPRNQGQHPSLLHFIHTTILYSRLGVKRICNCSKEIYRCTLQTPRMSIDLSSFPEWCALLPAIGAAHSPISTALFRVRLLVNHGQFCKFWPAAVL